MPGTTPVDAKLDLGLPADSREYGAAALSLLELGVRRLRLIANNPAMCQELDGYGIEVAQRALSRRVARQRTSATSRRSAVVWDISWAVSRRAWAE